MHIKLETILITALSLSAASGCSSNPASPATPPPSKTSPPSSMQNPKAYVGLFGEKSVAVIDSITYQVLDTIPVTAPDGLVLTPDGKKVYVASGDTGTVKVIATDSDSIIG